MTHYSLLVILTADTRFLLHAVLGEIRMEQSEKMKEKFRVSRERLKKWERSFLADFQRRPTKEDMAAAPQQVQICYRNCWKIKAYFESKARSDSRSSSGVSRKKQENCDEVKKITQKSELQHQSFNKPQKTSVTSVKQVPKISVKKVHDNNSVKKSAKASLSSVKKVKDSDGGKCRKPFDHIDANKDTNKSVRKTWIQSRQKWVKQSLNEDEIRNILMM